MTLKSSSLFHHALRALVDLSLYQTSGQVKVATIAKRQGIPPRCLEQIFNRLRRRGLVVAERGPRGGYRLARSAGEIRISDVFESLGSSNSGRHDSLEGQRAADPAAAVWKQVEAAVQATLKVTTLEALVAQAQGKAPSPIPHPYPFHI